MKCSSIGVWVCLAALFTAAGTHAQQSRTTDNVSEESKELAAAELAGDWVGKTSQGFPISLKIEDVDGKAVITELNFEMRVQGPRFALTGETLIKPLLVEVVDGKFHETWPADGPGASPRELKGEFSSPSSLSGSLRESHRHPTRPEYGTAVAEVTYTATKKQGEKTTE
jgi:hypothetical protein